MAFYFKDPGALWQKLLEVYNFQNVHRRRRYDGELRGQLIQDIVAARQIREQSERYLPFVDKVYMELCTKYGVKPLPHRCEFSPEEVEEFISEVTRVKQRHQLGEEGKRTLVAVTTDPGETMMDVEQRTPSQASMFTPRQFTPKQSLVSGRGSAMKLGSTGGSAGSEGSSLFRARVQSEMRSGGGGGGSHSQCTTPTGSVCSKPSPLLNDKRASQPLPLPVQQGIPLARHINPHTHISSLRTPPSLNYMTNTQTRHQVTSHKQPLNRPTRSVNPLLEDQQSVTPMSAKPRYVARIPGEGSMNLLTRTGDQRCKAVGVHMPIGSSKQIRPSFASPTLGQRMHANPMSTGVTPGNLGSVRQLSHFPGSRLSSASACSFPSSADPRSINKQGFYGTQSHYRRHVPAGYGSERTSLLLPAQTSVGLNSVQRKPLSGR